jgi:glycosyltransferase involved in cell wall biosynthesis
MEPSMEEKNKENLILSVARFEEGGSKKQLEMMGTFLRLKQLYPQAISGWQLILAGGSTPDNPYLKKIQRLLSRYEKPSIEIKTNIAATELRDLYRKAKIFWHMCGLGESDPALVEHFGMTIGESMQNRVVPLVFHGGGQKEIVDHGKCGFTFKTTSELLQHTLELVRNPGKIDEMGKHAYEKSRSFCKEAFQKKVVDYFQGLLKDYVTFPE